MLRRRWFWLALACGVLCLSRPNLVARDWPQWGGTDARNMVSDERDLPESFVPGEKDTPAGRIKLETAKNVRWGVKLCQAIYSTPVVAQGKIFIGGRQPGLGLLLCVDEKTGNLLWQWQGPARKVPTHIDGFLIGISPIPDTLGVCSTPMVDGDRVYFMAHSFKLVCLDVSGQPVAGKETREARVVWE